MVNFGKYQNMINVLFIICFMAGIIGMYSYRSSTSGYAVLNFPKSISSEAVFPFTTLIIAFAIFILAIFTPVIGDLSKKK